MYVSIYGHGQDPLTGRRTFLGNITNVSIEMIERVYDLNSTTIKGKCEFETDGALIYVVNTPEGRPISAGIVRNIRPGKGTLIEFKGEDFKKILDTDVLLDFTGEQPSNFFLGDLFEKVTTAVIRSNGDAYMNSVDLSIIHTAAYIDPREIADYAGQYIIVNALKFMKVYLAYYNHYIKTTYDQVTDTITFEFIDTSYKGASVIRLNDFKHERTQNDIKVNKVVATIKYSPEIVPADWGVTTKEYYDTQPTTNKASIDIKNGMPPAAGYPAGFALETYERIATGFWSNATVTEFNAAEYKIEAKVRIEGAVCRMATYDEAVNAMPDGPHYGGTVARVRASINVNGVESLCAPIRYIKMDTRETLYNYYKMGDQSFAQRPDLPERVYLLGLDNEIYDSYGSIEESNRIYPIVTKIFESTYLAEAQINAVYELVNNRYVENIILDDEMGATPIDLRNYELYHKFRVMDKENEQKTLPITEKITTHENGKTSIKVKLGFKKTLLTEVIKHDIGEGSLIRQGSGGGGGNTQVIEEKYEIWDKPTAPPSNYDTWFKPITNGPLLMRTMSPRGRVLNFNYDDSEQVEVENEFGADGISQDTTPQLPREEEDR